MVVIAREPPHSFLGKELLQAEALAFTTCVLVRYKLAQVAFGAILLYTVARWWVAARTGGNAQTPSWTYTFDRYPRRLLLPFGLL